MTLEEFNSMNRSDNEHNCSLNDNFNTSFTSSTTDCGITEDFQAPERTLEASDSIQPEVNSTTSGSDGTLLPASVTGLTREAAETTAGDQHAPTTEATDGSMRVAPATTEPTIEETDGTMPVAVATSTTEPTTEAMHSTMQVTTAAMETTGETTETTGSFDISKIISIKSKELRTNSDRIANNISYNELPNCSTLKSNRFAV